MIKTKSDSLGNEKLQQMMSKSRVPIYHLLAHADNLQDNFTKEKENNSIISCNISKTRDDVSSGYPNTEKRVARNSRCLDS